MIVSDSYGLRRYRTGDLFLCRRKIKRLPDLVFVRRSGLQYSFTGEKLTAEQISLVFEQLRERYPQVCADRYLTCVPSAETIPHYKVLLVSEARNGLMDLHEMAARCDEFLCAKLRVSQQARKWTARCCRFGPDRREGVCGDLPQRVGIAVQVSTTLSLFNWFWPEACPI